MHSDRFSKSKVKDIRIFGRVRKAKGTFNVFSSFKVKMAIVSNFFSISWKN